MPAGIILLVEDDPTLQLVIKAVVNRLGYDCQVVGSGEEAVEQAGAEISLIFMDVGLPGITGAHATLFIREKELKERRKRVPIVGLTSHAFKEQCLHVGMDDFLQKPALLADIQRMLDKWLRPAQANIRT